MCRAFEETKNEKAIQIAKNLIAMEQMSLEMISQPLNCLWKRYRACLNEDRIGSDGDKHAAGGCESFRFAPARILSINTPSAPQTPA